MIATERPGQKFVYDNVFHALLVELRRDQSHSEHKYPNLFGNIFDGHFVNREMVGFNMFWKNSKIWTD